MVFQWQLFVLLFVIGFLTLTFRQYTVVNFYGQKEKRYDWLPVLAITLPLIYLSGTRTKTILNFGDTSAYLSGFKNAPNTWSGLFAQLTSEYKDKGFAIFTFVIKGIIGNREIIYFTIIAAVCILCVMLTYKEYSCNFLISAFLFIASADYLQWTYNGIRQFIPASILFACAGLLLKKKYSYLIVLILILSTIHASALLMLPMIFVVQGKPWNKKTLFFIVAIIIAIAFVEQFTDIVASVMENTQYSSEVDQYLNTEGTSIQRVIVYSIPAFLSLIFKRRIGDAENPLINLSVNMSILTAFSYLLSSYTSGLFIGRIPIYFSLYNYILLPWIIEKIFTKRSSMLIYVVLIVDYLVYYYYQVDIVWGL